MRPHSPLLLALALLLAGPAQASQPGAEDLPDLQLALVRYPGEWNPRPTALSRLAWEIRKRTSIAVSLETAAADPSRDELFSYPFIVWQGDRSFATLPEKAVHNLRQHLTQGGTLLVDVSDAIAGGPFDSSVRRELRRIFPDQQLTRVPAEHTIYKSFYLLDRHGGRVPTKPFLEGLYVEDRLAVVLSSNDLGGAMARDEFGQWQYDVGQGGDTTREMSFRLGVNLVMYSLCLDYKEDQVHIPFILQRRR